MSSKKNMKPVQNRTTDWAVATSAWFVRIALAAAFFSAVADRFGFWGAPGASGVAWGNIAKYEEYVATLVWFVPVKLISVIGWLATVAEILLAVGLLIGWQLRWVAVAAGLLLSTFAIAMCAALGLKAPLDYSVLSAAGAAFLLSAMSDRRSGHSESNNSPHSESTCSSVSQRSLHGSTAQSQSLNDRTGDHS